MDVDRTDPYDLMDWIQDRHQRIGFKDDFLAATSGLRPATDEQFEWFLGQGLEDIIEFTGERVKGRGRPWKRMMRVVVAWCIAHGWWPYDAFLAEATSDARRWLSRTEWDARLSFIDQVALDIARARREMHDGRTAFTCFHDRRHHSLPKSPTAVYIDVSDDEGVQWRIWSDKYHAVATLRVDDGEDGIPPQPEQEAPASSRDPTVIDLQEWLEAKNRGGDGHPWLEPGHS